MKRIIEAEFETLDAAETAAIAVNKQLGSGSGAEGIYVRPKYPESVQLTIQHQKHFTLLPTAIASMNYITALVETDYNFEDLNEVQKRQTSSVEFYCDDKAAALAEKILIQMGGTIISPS